MCLIILIFPSLTTLRFEVWLLSELDPMIGIPWSYWSMAADILLITWLLRLMTERR
jgi:hypothetical protein